MDLRKLHHAVTLASTQHYTRAAALLHITPAALSQSIIRLEAEVGFRLFDRDRKGARVTSAGRSFLAKAEDLLRQARNLSHEAALLSESKTGAVAFGLGSMPASFFLTPLLLELAEHHPTITTEAYVAPLDNLLKALLAEELDFFFAASNMLEERSDLNLRPLLEAHSGLFVRREHPLAAKPSVRIEEVVRYPLLTTRIATVTLKAVRNTLRLRPGDPFPATTFCDDMAALKALALSGDCILLGPGLAVKEDCRNGTLTELHPKNAGTFRVAVVSLVSLADRTLSPAAIAAIACIERVVASHTTKASPARVATGEHRSG